MSVIFLRDFQNKEAKEILEIVKYVSTDIQTFLASHPHLTVLEVVGASMWEHLAILDGNGIDAAAVAEAVLANFYRVKEDAQ